MKNLLGRLKRAKSLEACRLTVLPTTSFAAGTLTVNSKMPEIWQMTGNSTMGVVAVFVTDAAVLTLAREACESQQPKSIKFRGHWLEIDPKDKPRLAFYAVSIERR